MEFLSQRDKITIRLPVTTPTGKVRVKRPFNDFSPEPVACRSKPIGDTDYLEWQISYDTDSLQEPSVVKSVVLNKPQGIRYGCELTCLLVESIKLGLLAQEKFKELEVLIKTPLQAGIEELEKIRREEDHPAKTIATGYGFARHYLRVPNYLKESVSYSVEIKIAHKQRAVGNQAMIYVNLPFKFCQSQSSFPLIGRCAEKNEKVDYIIDCKNIGLVFDTLVAFALASLDHRNDLKMIFDKL